MRNKHLCCFQNGLLIAVLFLIFSSAFLQGKELIPRSLIFEAPEKLNPQISPDGKYISYLAPIDQVMNVWIRTIGINDDKPLTRDTKSGINMYKWTKNGKYILFIQDKNGDQNWHLFAIDIKKRKTRDLTPFSDVSVGFIADSLEKPDEILIVMNKENRLVQDVYKLNIVDGSISLIQKNPGNVVHWVTNSKLEILGAVTVMPNGGGALMYRENTDAVWKEFLSWNQDDNVRSLGMTADGRYWILLHNINSDLMRIVKKDLKTKEETVIYSPKKADTFDVMMDKETGYPIGALEVYDSSYWQALDKRYIKDFKYLNSFGERFYGIANTDREKDNWLIYSLEQGHPINYYLYNHKDIKLTFLFSHRSKLEKYDLPKMETVNIPTRDGLTMVSYITKPDNVDPAKAPLLIYPAPEYRTRYFPNFNTIHIWLANRGYTVLVVNYRGLHGFGKKFMNAGKYEWGGKVVQDIEDAVNWTIEKKLANPEKIGIMGNSIGGYVALASTAFSNINFNACISVSGPMNLLSFVKSAPAYANSFIVDLKMNIGDYETNSSFLKRISPFYNINSFKTPCFIVQGKHDIFVDSDEAYQFAKALKGKRIPVTYIEFANEDHGYPNRRENLNAFAAAAEKFLAEYLGGVVEPMSAKERRILKAAIKIYQ